MTDEPLSENDLIEESGALIYSIAAAPGLQVGQPGIAFAGHSAGLLRSQDGGATWQDALEALSLSDTLPVTALALTPNFEQDGRVFAGAPGGIFLSSDSGQSWKAVLFPPPSPSISALVVSPNYASDQTIFAGTMEDGVFISQDGGERWIAWNFGLLDLNVMCLAISPNFAADETLFAGTETGIFRSTNGGRAWREVEMPFGFDPVLSLVFSPTDAQPQTLFAGTENQGLWVSTDAGETWSRLAEDTLVDPANILLADSSGLLVVTSAGMWHSSDGGESWTDRLPEEYTGQEISAVLAPQGLKPGSLLLVGFTGGSIQPVALA